MTVMLICASEAAMAQSYSASGQIGYLQEWEIKGEPGQNHHPLRREYEVR